MGFFVNRLGGLVAHLIGARSFCLFWLGNNVHFRESAKKRIPFWWQMVCIFDIGAAFDRWAILDAKATGSRIRNDDLGICDLPLQTLLFLGFSVRIKVGIVTLVGHF